MKKPTNLTRSKAAIRPHPLILLLTLSAGVVLLVSCSSSTLDAPVGAGENWAHYLGHPTSNQYSALDQINQENVHTLEIAWTYETGEGDQYQSNNLIVDGMLYTVPPTSHKAIALNAATGEHLWAFDPEDYHDVGPRVRQRGVMYWEDGDDRRILTSKGPWLYALNAETGELIPSFGEGGWIHMGDAMDVEGRANVFLNTPGYVYNDMIIIGANVGGTPGAVRAFDVRTGERQWIFHTLPRPGEFGSETWPDGYLQHTGGASDWSGIAIDTERGIVYVSTETARPDFYGGHRWGKNLFANSIIALDANTGERLWHYQLVHHDLWDRDLPAPPTLLTVEHEGAEVDVVAQGTKMGLLFVFNRVTGEPLWPIEERPAPKSKISGIHTWPTQPFPTKPPPLMRQKYTEDDVSNISPQAHRMTMNALSQSGSYGPFPPPSLERQIMFPGFDGGMEWGGAAADPDGILYVNLNEIPWFYQLVPTTLENATSLPEGERLYRIHCAVCHGVDRTGNLAGGVPSLVDVSDRYSKEDVKQIMTQGGGGRMPAFDQLPEEQLQAIVDYLFGDEQPADREARSADDELVPRQLFETQPYVFAGFQRWLDDEGYPAIKPPWGTLSAVNLNTGEIKWQVPLGEYEELTARGIPVTGTENYGGPIVTAGGLVFIAATDDEKIRAFDKETGEILWEADLPYDGNATPSTYLVDGKQYIVISAGDHKVNGSVNGTIVAFTLPD